MPVSQLWAVDVYGQVYSLSTAGQQWEKCSNAHMEFKRVTATQQCCWGIAFDNSVYLNVHASELPIRYQEETYENQRWNPVDGFSDHLLPSDRWQWSDVTGLQHQPLNGFQLPSHSWDWEDDWYWVTCFDLSCGGWEISEEPRGQLSLWAVSLQGKVWFRDGVCHHNPEGSSWEEVPLPGEVVQISCGPGDLVWAVLWDGQLIVRQGISRDCPKGTSWVVVESPSPEVGAAHVAVGTSVAWAVTKNNKVWFRRGVNSHNPCGSGWISMVGEMIMISVGLNDQVWAISCEDRTVCFRQGVTSSELTEGAFGHVTSTAPDPLGDATFNLSIEAPTPRIPKVTSDSFISELVSDRESGKASRDVGSAIVQEEEEEAAIPGEVHVPPLSSNQSSGAPDPQWSNVDLEETQIQHGQSAADSSSLSSVATYTFAMEDGADERPLWAWVSGGGCSVDSHSPLSWFNCSGTTSVSFHLLAERVLPRQSVWVKKGAIQWWRDWKPHKWVDVHLALEQFSGAEGYKDGILFIYYNYYDEKKYLHAFINEVTILVPVLNKSKHTFALYTPERTKQRWPIRLAALALLSVSCCNSRGVHGPPSKQAIWSTTCNGDVFVSEPSPALEANPYPTPSDQMFWRQVGGHLRLVECNSLGVVWGLGYDHTAWVYTGGYGGGFFQGLASSTDNIYTQTDVKSVYIYENQRWNPVSGYTNRGLPTDRYMWSDVSGLHECTKTGTKPPSPQWTWVSDWSVDYSVSGGTDREGWQYAADFPASYSGYKTIKDFVRRRRWARKCKLTTTGPWQEIPPIPLSDVTILPCVAQSSVDLVPVWAIGNKGDVLCRLGVTTLTPAGSSWLHVETDQPFKSISIGAASQVWAIARDGSAFHRGLVSPQKPAGDCWYHIPSPVEQKLKQISVGCTSVYAVDENGNLWYRQGVTPNCPQGSTWEHISNNVRKVSVGPLNQVWIIADKVQGSHSLSRGTVCHRLGVSPMEPKGQSWDYGIGVKTSAIRSVAAHQPVSQEEEEENRNDKIF
uniref:Tectonin beta-propeller repeat-containing protein 1 n=1 Tax=Nothobranchius furzeri TaxID=105023 RepID=A0A8C6M350_NOTFU